MNDEITLEPHVDAVLGLMTAEGAEGASLLDEPIRSAATDPDAGDGDEDQGEEEEESEGAEDED